MNEEKTIPQNALKPEQHPLHMLDSQADPETKPKIILQKPIRTYESDVAEAFAKRKTSLASMIIEERKKESVRNTVIDQSPRLERTGNNSSKKLFLVVLSIIIILSGIGGGYYLYKKSPLANKIIPVKVNTKIPSIIIPDIQKILTIGNSRGEVLANNIKLSLIDSNIQMQQIYELILTENNSSTTNKLSSTKLIERLNIEIPEILGRSLTNEYMIGAYGDTDTKIPFIILKNNFFQNAFAGMLKWESSMPDDLITLLNYKDKIETSTTTNSMNPYFSIKGKFEDKIILNRDIREFITEDKTIILLYSFIDKDTIIITSSETTINGIIDRLERQSNMR